jgi:BlaI family penicillinase repressor
VKPRLPDLSRFELQLLRRLWDRDRATARELHDSLENPPSYSTIRKIIERLEQKGAVERCDRYGNAWVYRPTVARGAMMRREVRRFLDGVFEGAVEPLVAHLVDMNELSLDDLQEIERRVDGRKRPRGRRD